MRLYVTGGTGLVGSHVIKLGQERYNMEVIASLYGPPPDTDVDYVLDPLDLSDHDAVRQSLLKYKPDAVIQSAALLDQVMIDEQRETAWAVMVESTRVMAETCREIGARLVFVSSDWVFDGRKPLVNETSPPHPVNFYGVMKFASERELSTMSDLNYAVGRIAGVYGENIAVRSLTRRDQGLGFELANYVIRRLRENKPAGIWMGPKANDVSNPTLASDAADMLLRLARHDKNGIYHCMGSDSISRLEFALLIAEVFDFDPALVKPVPTDPEVLAAHRNISIPFRTRVSTERTGQELGRQAMGIRAGIEAFYQEWLALGKP
jgi:dTDP-4-dehydrorhamnose reductase